MPGPDNIDGFDPGTAGLGECTHRKEQAAPYCKEAGGYLRLRTVMNDGYEEILVKKQPTSKDALLKGLVVALAVVPILGGILYAIPFAIPIGVILGIVGYYFLFPMLDLEYEYLYVGGDIDIDKIMSKRKRKRVGSWSKDNLEILAPTGSDQLASYLKSGKVKDYSSGNPDVKTWTAVYGTESSADIVIMELTDEIVQDLRRYAPRKVFFS